MESRKIDKKIKKRNKKAEKAGKMSAVRSFILIAVGGVIGLINGFFGGGGGMICVPLLERFLKLPEKEAHASAIAVIFPLTFVSSIVYILSGGVQSLPLLTIGGGVIVGGILGSFLLKWLPPKVIGIIFAILMLVAGVRLII